MDTLSQSAIRDPQFEIETISAPEAYQSHTDRAHDLADGADQFAIRNHQSSIIDSPNCREAVFPPENARARHTTADAFSSQSSTKLNDGIATCSNQETDSCFHNDGYCPEQNETAGAENNMGRAGLSSVGCNDSLPPSAQDAQPARLKLTAKQLREGARKLAIITRAIELKAANLTWEQIEKFLDVPASTLIRWFDQAARQLHVPELTTHNSPLLTAAQCAPQNHKAGRPPKHKLSPEQIAQIKAIALPINRDYKSSSTPEAVRRSIAAGILPASRSDVGSSDSCPVRVGPLSAQDILERSERGLPLLTASMRDQVALTEMEVRAYRSPNEAQLDYVQSPGSLMLTRDPITGAERFWQPGEAYTIDDGSINFGCCVPMERPGDKCWEKFGVIVGRFQFIPVVDHRTRAILGFSYTARPRDSYRAEDLTATMQTVFAEHGLPRVMFLEYGVSDSNLVNETLRRAGVEPKHVKSPHEKVVEKAFDLLWTKLSSMPGQVGRFRGEMEDENCLLTACKQGHKDPRKYFPSLPQVLAALRQAIAEQNAQWMNSQQYGRWQPGPWFARDAHKVTRRLAAQDAWMFAPVITKPLIVRGFSVGTSVSLMPGFSLKFHFDLGDFAADLIGDEIILHFNPFAPDCVATAVHARTGKLLGECQQINRHARFTRRAFGYGADPDIGHIAARKHAQALHRTMMAVKVGTVPARQGPPRGPSGQIANATAEHRDGLGNLVRAEVGRVAPRAPSENVGCNVTLPPSAEDARAASAEQITARKETRSRLAAIAAQLRGEDGI
jgi:hypothetical protein